MTTQSSSPSTRSGQNGRAIAALVTGIVGIVFAVLFAIVGLALGVVAVALGFAARPPPARDGARRPPVGPPAPWRSSWRSSTW